MPATPAWRRYLRLFGPDPGADAKDEVRFHIDAKAADLMAQGMEGDEARREAERQFGNRGAIESLGEQLGRERVRGARNQERRTAFRQDLRYAWRTLRKDRAFTVVTVAILALAIATNTTVFSVVNTVLLRPLPFPRAQQLVWLASGRATLAASHKESGLSDVTYTVDAYWEFARRNHSFQQMACYNPFFGNSEYTLIGRGEPQPVAGVWVSETFFQTLGVPAALGRLLTKEEFHPGGPNAVLISHAFWQTRFGGDPRIVGQSITLRQGAGKGAATVVGVLPESFDFGAVFAPGLRFDMFLPAVLEDMRDMGNTLAVVGRLKPGVTAAKAQAEADIVFPQIMAAHKDWWGDYTSTLTSLKQFVSGKLERPLVVLWSAAALILLIACVNLSNLMLARGAARNKEFALRSALGAGRGRLLAQLLTEGALLTGAGAVLGLAFAFAVTRYLAHQGSIALPLLNRVTLDGAALLWTILITAAVTLLFGLVPAFSLRAADLQSALKDATHGASSGRQHEFLRSLLVISEVALACVLAVGAGLLLRSFLKILDVDLGFRPSQAAVIRVDYDDGGRIERRGVVLQEILRRISAIPGIEAAGIADMLPLGRNRTWGLSAKGKVYTADEDIGALVRIVTPGYIRAMGMRLLSGRDFDWTDNSKSQRVMIINQAAARRYWGTEDPFSRLALVNGREFRVVGVIANVCAHNLETAAGPEMFLPAMQRDPEGAELVIRTQLPPDSLAGPVMKTLRELTPSQPAAELLPLQQIVDRSVSPRRFFVGLVGTFAALGLILASLGVYGVISYSVARRGQEIGIRMALGANAAQVQMAVLNRALKLALAGIAAGCAASFIAARSLESLLFGMRPADPVTFAAICLLLIGVALAAGYFPARRAARIDPTVTLRAGE